MSVPVCHIHILIYARSNGVHMVTHVCSARACAYTSHHSRNKGAHMIARVHAARAQVPTVQQLEELQGQLHVTMEALGIDKAEMQTDPEAAILNATTHSNTMQLRVRGRAGRTHCVAALVRALYRSYGPCTM